LDNSRKACRSKVGVDNLCLFSIKTAKCFWAKINWLAESWIYTPKVFLTTLLQYNLSHDNTCLSFQAACSLIEVLKGLLDPNFPCNLNVISYHNETHTHYIR
jgi:hypothetical protein